MTRACLVLLLIARVGLAQPVGVLGKPLPDPSLPVGALVVRVVAGTARSPAAGVVVTIKIGGKQRTATTTADGRASFEGLAVGANVDVSAPSKAPDLAHGSVVIPASGGVRMMLSTTSWGGVTTPGLPKPREFSGRVRADGAAGTFGVRLSYNDLADPMAPAKVSVALVGYASDGKVSVVRRPTDATGTATFNGLDASGLTAYFAFAQLTRGTRVDRLVSEVATLERTAGARVVLSSHARTSTEPAIDLDATPASPVAKDKVRVTLEGIPDPAAAVELFDAATGKSLAKTTAKPNERSVEVSLKPTPGQVVYAQSSARGETYRSRPMLLLADRGAVLSVIAVPRTLFTFELIGQFEAGVFSVMAQLTVANNAWSPLPPPRTIPLPAGFTNAVLGAESEQHARLTTTGIELTAPIPPGGRVIRTGFALPIKAGKARVAMDLPDGTFDSQIRIENEPGVALELPAGIVAVRHDDYLAVQNITIKPKQSIVFSVTAPVLDPKQAAIVKACGSLSPNRRSPLLGKPMPDFTARLVDGTSFTLSSLRGNQLIVAFNASWDRLHNDQMTLPKVVLPKTTQVVAVMSDKTAADVAKAFGTLPFRVALDPPIGDAAIGPITGRWGITAIPETYVVDRAGIVRAHFVNERDWTDKALPGCLRALE